MCQSANCLIKKPLQMGIVASLKKPLEIGGSNLQCLAADIGGKDEVNDADEARGDSDYGG